MTEVTIDSVMDNGFPRLFPAMPIREAAAALVAANAPGAPVLDDGGALVGMLTQKDCFRPALNASYYRQWNGTVAERMTPAPVTLDAGDDIVTAAEAFLAHPYRVFPVLREGTLVGMLHRTAVLAALLRLGG